MQQHNQIVKSRWALEALRNGVPNRAAVEMLGCNQPEAESRFVELLGQASSAQSPPSSALGMLVSGDFGAGKSHLLTHFEQLALSKGFVCSKVAVSKETPLFDLAKVYKSAIENGRIAGSSGRLVEELALKIDRTRNSARYADFFLWANNTPDISQLFPATMKIREEAGGDAGVNSEIEAFWSGERIQVQWVRQNLREIGHLQSFSIRAPRATELPPQRLQFFLKLVQAAGYKGCVVLLDEIELVRSYSRLQRGRSYVELARWMGQFAGESYPGLVTVGTVTDDFESATIIDGYMDRDNVPPMLETRYPHLVEPVRSGMRLFREAAPLKAPSDVDVQDTVEKIRQIYSNAYNWNALPIPESADGVGYHNRMRYRVRSAINEWDLRRLYPGYQPETESEEFRYTYYEDPDLGRESSETEEPDDA